MVHELKIRSEYFEAVCKGKKTFEVRKNDRPFHVGDLLGLNEIDFRNGTRYTGRAIVVRVTYILNDYPDLLREGAVILGIKVVELTDAHGNRATVGCEKWEEVKA